MLSKKLGIDKNSLKKALTHFSFYEAKDEAKANSRLVFAGMFIFKAQVAEILFKYFNGSGTQLQHILGNLFRTQYLNRLFDNWGLKSLVRTSENFDIETHKHIFVYAVFGCISNLDIDTRRRFIFKYILNEDNAHIINHFSKNKDLFSQVNEIARMLTGKKLITEMYLTEDGLHKAVVMYENSIVIAEAISKSYKYARKKAMKLSLEILSQINFEKYVEESNYLERIEKRIEAAKEKHSKEIALKIEAREKLRKEKLEESKKIRKYKDLARRKAQAEAKKRKAEKAEILAKMSAKNQAPMSAKKRRFLEDKKK